MAMARTVQPEPFTWFSTPAEQVLQPIESSGFLSASGEKLLSAEQLLEQIYPHPRKPLPSLPPARNPVVVQACIAYAQGLANPAAAGSSSWAPIPASSGAEEATIDPLISHPFWSQIDVLAAPLHLRHRRLPVAATADLLVRFRNGGDLGIGILQCGHSEELDRLRVAAEVGAALAFLGDTFGWWPQRAFVLFCCAGRTTVEAIDHDIAVPCWLEALDVYRFMAKTFQWENLL
jgi:hypothetical protein